MTTERKPTETSEPGEPTPTARNGVNGNAGTIWINATWRDKPEYRKLAADDDEANRVLGQYLRSFVRAPR